MFAQTYYFVTKVLWLIEKTEKRYFSKIFIYNAKLKRNGKFEDARCSHTKAYTSRRETLLKIE